MAGTKNSVAQKHRVVAAYLEAVTNKGYKEIDKEKFIATIMVKCKCERRVASEIIHAHALYNGFSEQKKEGRRVYIPENE